MNTAKTLFLPCQSLFKNTFICGASKGVKQAATTVITGVAAEEADQDVFFNGFLRRKYDW
jgi:hypothetical protein